MILQKQSQDNFYIAVLAGQVAAVAGQVRSAAGKTAVAFDVDLANWAAAAVL